MIRPDGFVKTIAGPVGGPVPVLGTAPGANYSDGAATSALFSWPYGVALDEPRKLLYVTDRNGGVAGSGGNMLRMLDLNNMNNVRVSTIAGNYLAASPIARVNAPGGPWEGVGLLSRFNYPYSVVVSYDSNTIYIGEAGGNAVRAIDPITRQTKRIMGLPTGSPCNYANVPNEGPGTSLEACWADGVGVDINGNTYVYHSAGAVSRLNTTGYAKRLAGVGGYDQTLTAGVVTSTVAPVVTALQVYFCWGAQISTDPATRNTYVADYCNNRIAMVTDSGIVTTLAGDVLYGTGKTVWDTTTYSGCKFTDGTGTNAGFCSVDGVWYDASCRPSSTQVGCLYVADTGNNAIRRVTLSSVNNGGIVTTISGPNPNPLTPASPAAAGFVDGVGTNARFNSPDQVTTDPFGNIYVADTSNCAIRKIEVSLVNGASSYGMVSTIAGYKLPGSSGAQCTWRDGVGTSSRLAYPTGVGVDQFLNVYVADASNGIIRKIVSRSAFPACDDKWHHVALTHGDPRLGLNWWQVYLDGVASGTPTEMASAITVASSLRIAYNGDTTLDGGELYAGVIDDIRIYNRALSPSEVLFLSQPAYIFPNAINPPPEAGASSYRWICAAGSYGASATIVKSATINTWSWVGGNKPNCLLCPANQYSYAGSIACSSCPAGYSLISSSLGCAPRIGTGPNDTYFYYTGDSGETLGTFSGVKAGITATTDVMGLSTGASMFAGNNYLTVSAGALDLPYGNDAVTMASWTKCTDTVSKLTQAVVAYGTPSIVTAQASLKATTSTTIVTNTPYVYSLAGVVTRSTDGIGTSASFYYPVGIASDPYGNLVIGESWQAVIRRVDSTTKYVQTILNAPGLPGYENTFAIVSSIVASSPSSGLATLYTGTTRVLSNGQQFQLTGTTGWDGFYFVNSIVDGVSITFGTANVNPTSTGIAYNYHPIQVQGVGADGVGNYYLPDLNTGGIWMINASSYARLWIAGGRIQPGGPWVGFADGVCSSALFNSPRGISVTDDGLTIYVADLSNQRVRKIVRTDVVTNANCTVTTMAGNGGYGSANGVGSAATFSNLREISFFTTGNVIVGDFGSNQIRMVAVDGTVTTVAGGNGGIQAGYRDGVGTNALFNGPRSAACVGNNDIYVVDQMNHMIRKIFASGSGGTYSAGAVTTVAGGNGVANTGGFTPPYGYLDGTGTASLFNAPASITRDAMSNIYVMDNGNFKVRRISAGTFIVTTLAGNGNGAAFNAAPTYPVGSALIPMGATMGSNDNVGTNAQFCYARDITGDPTGTLYVSDSGNNLIRKIEFNTDVVTTFAGTRPAFSLFIGGQGQGIAGYVDSADPLAARFRQPWGVITTGSVATSGSFINTFSGALYVVDTGNNMIRSVAIVNGAAGAVTTLAGKVTAGFADATGTNAAFNIPRGIAVKSDGTALYVADAGNNRIRSISLAPATLGVVATVAGAATPGYVDGIGGNALFFRPSGLVFDPVTSSLFVADANNHALRKIDLSSNTVSKFAGGGVPNLYADGIGTSAMLNLPMDVTTDGFGNLYVADMQNNLVRRVSSTTAAVVTIAGGASTGAPPSAALTRDGYGTDAGLRRPIGIHVDSFAAVYVVQFGATPYLDAPIPAANSPIDTTSIIRVIEPAFAASPVCDGKWHHICTVHGIGSQTDTSRYYVDGIELLSVQQVPWKTAPAKSALNIAWNGDMLAYKGELFTGAIDDLRIYKRGLSASEVLTLSQPPFGLYANIVMPTLNASVSTYVVQCSPGYAGATVTFTKTSDNSWSASGPVSCTICPAGTYTVLGNATSCIPCDGGLYGAYAGMAQAQCSGSCNPGYYCPPGSTSATQNPCGDANVYCPVASTVGASAPIAVSSGYYSVPLDAPYNARSAQCPCSGGDGVTCPAFNSGRSCVNGVLLPAIDLSPLCFGGSTTFELTDAMYNKSFGTLSANVAGMNAPADVTYTINTVANKPSDCPSSKFNTLLTTSEVTVGTTSTLQMFVSKDGASTNTIDATSCSEGLTSTITAKRNPAVSTTWSGGSSSLIGSSFNSKALDEIYSVNLVQYLPTCSVNILVIATLAPPKIVSCATMNVPERVPTSTVFGKAVSLASNTVASTIVYTITSAVASPNPGALIPFGIDCNGNLYSTRPFVWSTASSYNLTVRVDNVASGAAISAFCYVFARIIQQPVAPSLSQTSYSTYDLLPAGTTVASLVMTNNNNVGSIVYTSSSRWSVKDPNFDHFLISSTGVITVAPGANLDAAVYTLYNYKVNVSDALSWAEIPITITLLPSPRPPVIFPQTRTVDEGSNPGAGVPGGVLAASHPQGKSFTYSLIQPSFPFAITTSGSLFVSPLVTGAAGPGAPTLLFNDKPSYTVTAVLTDTSGKTATAVITIILNQVNLPPYFLSASFSRTVSEGLPSGAALDPAIYAIDPNLQDSVQYAVVTCSPLMYNPITRTMICPFTVDQITGAIKIAQTIPNNKLMADTNATFATPRGPYIYTLNVAAFDNGIPVRKTNANVLVQIVNILPRWNVTSLAITQRKESQSALSTVTMLAPFMWIPCVSTVAACSLAYRNAVQTNANNRSLFQFGSNNGEGPVNINDGRLAFELDTRTSEMFIPGAPSPVYNMNIQPFFTFPVVLTDQDTKLTATLPVTVTMAHINRAPLFNTTLISLATRGKPYNAFIVPASTPGAYGPLMSQFSYDLDSAIVSNDILTYSLGPTCSGSPCNGTTSALFSINPATGQVSITGTGIACPGSVCPLYELNIVATDSGIDSVPSGNLAASTIIYILADTTLTPITSAETYSYSIAENSPFGKEVGVVEIAGYGQALSFSLTPAGSNAGMPFPFSISSIANNKANITVAWDKTAANRLSFNNLDFESNNKALALGGASAGYFGTTTYTANLRCTALSGNYKDSVVILTVSNLAEAPYFTANRISNSASYVLQIVEHTPFSNAVGAPAYATEGTTIKIAYSGSGSTVVTSTLADPLSVIKATDDDCVSYPSTCEQNTLTYSWDPSTPAAVSNLFTINSATGAVTGSAAATALNFETTSSYSLRVRVTDTSGLFDTAAVTIKVYDVNEVATGRVLSYTKTASSFTTNVITSITVKENALDQTQSGQGIVCESQAGEAAICRIDGDGVGIISATDPDTGGLDMATSSYSFLPTSDGSPIPFDIDPTSGFIRINGQSSTLDWESASVYTYQVRVKDRSVDPNYPPLEVIYTLTVNVQDVNDITITNVVIDEASITVANLGTGSVDYGLNIIPGIPDFDTLYNAFSPLNVVGLMRGVGGATAVITGTNIGPTASRISTQGLGSVISSAVSISASFGPTGREFRTTSCAISNANTEIKCVVPAGTGAKHIWNVNLTYPATVSGGGANPITGAVSLATAFSTAVTAYSPPSIESVYVNSLAKMDANVNRIGTPGGDVFFVSGRDLGALNQAAWVYYGPGLQYISPCTVITPAVTPSDYAVASCTSVPGVGANLTFVYYLSNTKSVTATPPAFASSVPFAGSAVAYALPTMSVAYKRSGPAGLNTRGNEVIVINGTNFGPATAQTAAVLNVKYSASKWPYFYTATQCTVSIAHIQLTCTSAPGMGAGLTFLVTVAAQSMVAPSTAQLNYLSPVITSLKGDGTYNALTSGGQIVYVNGDQFGPATGVDSMNTLYPGEEFVYATYGRYRASYPLKYTAVTPVALGAPLSGCLVTTDHIQMTCYTTEGTGKDLFWAVSVGGQRSPVFLGQKTNYAPPVIAFYTGPGSHLALTQGNEIVNITGLNYGPVGTVISQGDVTYGLVDPDFNATDCFVSVPHTQICCKTAVGAGAGLVFNVVIDGQLNTAPTIDYGPPIIDSITGMTDASTDGGDIVTITGSFFSTQKWLDSVTYGRSGTEFIAANCTLTVNHAEIKCKTVPGTGRKLQWFVTVRGQTSAPVSIFTSYAAPSVTSATPLNGPTSGGYQVTLSGTNFGTLAKMQILFEAITPQVSAVSRPTDDQITAYLALLSSGSQIFSIASADPVAVWFNTLSKPQAILPVFSGNSQASVKFIVPAGFGTSRLFVLMVDGVATSTLTFNYDPPVINNIAPDRLNVPVGYLRLYIEGVNFCDYQNGCAELYIDNVKVTALSAPLIKPDPNYISPGNWSHTRAIAIVSDPGSTGSAVRIVVGKNATSNTVSFSAPVPAFDAITGQNNWGGATTKVTDAFVSFSLSLSSSSSALTAASIKQVGVGGPLRSAVSTAAGIPLNCQGQCVTISSITSSDGTITSLSTADTVNTVPLSARRLQTGSSVNVTISIDLVQSLSSANPPGSLDEGNVLAKTNSITAALTTSQLTTLVIAKVAQGLGIPASQLSASVIEDSIVKTVPRTVNLPALTSISTRGGDDFFINGVMSVWDYYPPAKGCAPSSGATPWGLSCGWGLGASKPLPVAVTEIGINIGGKACNSVTMQPYADITPNGLTDPTVIKEYLTFKIACKIPEGVGSNLPIIITTPGGNSGDNPNFRLSYSAPAITGVVAFDNACGYTAGESFLEKDSLGVHVRGIPTAGCKITVTGTNFGTNALSQALSAPQRVALEISGGSIPTLLVNAVPVSASHDHESVTFTVPSGMGKNTRIKLSIGGQDSEANSVQTVRFREPLVSQAFLAFGECTPTSVGPCGTPTDGSVPNIIRIYGSNFGPIDVTSLSIEGAPTGTIGSWDLKLTSRPLPFATTLEGVVPSGWGKNLPLVITVGGQTSIPVNFTYRKPTPTWISPAGGPTSGLNSKGNPINVTITGNDFGLAGTIEFRPSCYPTCTDPTMVTIPVNTKYVHNHTHIIFPMPEGAGADLVVVVNIGGNEAALTRTFSYDLPSVAMIGSRGQQVSSPSRWSFPDCAPRIQLVRSDVSNATSRLVNKTFNAGCFPTVSDPQYVVELSGESFGASFIPVAITIGGKLCPLISHTHTQALCYAPSGMGDRNEVLIRVGGRSNVVTQSSIYSYDPPVLGGVSPNRGDGYSGQAIELAGYNFGPIAAPVTITVGGLKCETDMGTDSDNVALPRTPAKWVSDGLLRCNTLPDVVGPKNITILAANRTSASVWSDYERFFELRCGKGSYGLRGEYCLPCGVMPGEQDGAVCPGGEMDFDLTVSKFGFWRNNVSDASMCSPLRASRTLPGGPGCPVFLACEPPEACLGSNKCGKEYSNCAWTDQDPNKNYECVANAQDAGRCAYCANRFYRVNGVCIKCPDSPWATVIIFVLLAVIAMTVAYTLNSKNINLSLISIGMDWAQVVAMFARTRINWPPLVKQIFHLLSAFNFNLEIIAPECAIPNVTYAGKWLFIEGMPIFAWSFLAFLYVAQLLFKWIVMGVEKKDQLHNHIHGLVATGVVVQRVLFLYMSRTTLDIFNCSPTTPPDYDKEGKEIRYMAWNISIICNQPGGTHLFLLPFAVAALIIYIIGLPILSVTFLSKNKTRVKYDQILRAQNAGDDKATNPNFAFRNTWKALYMNYRPGSWYWEFVICVRKFLIAFCSLMFRATPSFQLAMALLVLFIAYVLQVRTLPYLSHSIATQVQAEHERKVREGDKLHCEIEEDMAARAAYYARNGSSNTLALEKGVKAGSARKLAGAKAAALAKGLSPTAAFLASKRSTFETQVMEGRKAILSNKTATFIFDYNTAEAVLLASAILVNLAGICFDSTRFTAVNLLRPAIQAEYDSLASAIIVILILSIIYWFVVLGFDILLVTAPETVTSCLARLSSAGGAAKNSFSKAIGVKSGSSSKTRKTVKSIDSADDPNVLHTDNNPLLLARQGATDLDDKIVNASEPPSASQWAAFQARYEALRKEAKEAKAGLAKYQNDFGNAEVGGSRAKKEFSPVGQY